MVFTFGARAFAFAQERWVAKVVHRRSANQLTTMPGDGEHDLQLQISSHVHFRARLMLHAKIKHHSVKKSRKVAALVAELLEEAHLPAVEEAAPGSRVGGAPQSEFTKLQERLESLLEEATFHKQHAQQLERENKRLQVCSQPFSRARAFAFCLPLLSPVGLQGSGCVLKQLTMDSTSGRRSMRIRARANVSWHSR